MEQSDNRKTSLQIALVVWPDDTGDITTQHMAQKRIEALMRNRANVVVFKESARILPAVIYRTIGQRVRADVEMTLLDALPFDPRAQLALLEIVSGTIGIE